MPRMSEKELLHLTVNGDKVSTAARPHDTLLDILRDNLGLVGTKRGCDDGSCGACTVLIGDGLNKDGLIDGDSSTSGGPALSCLVLAMTVEGRSVTTIEAAGAHPRTAAVQQALVEEGGIQCGYCTPGIVLAAHAFLERVSADSGKPSRDAIARGLSNNLCRCTGYARVIEAISVASEKSSVASEQDAGSNCVDEVGRGSR
jgi:carbon-monoxide dehydrogenase small subunit